MAAAKKTEQQQQTFKPTLSLKDRKALLANEAYMKQVESITEKANTKANAEAEKAEKTGKPLTSAEKRATFVTEHKRLCKAAKVPCYFGERLNKLVTRQKRAASRQAAKAKATDAGYQDGLLKGQEAGKIAGAHALAAKLREKANQAGVIVLTNSDLETAIAQVGVEAAVTTRQVEEAIARGKALANAAARKERAERKAAEQAEEAKAS